MSVLLVLWEAEAGHCTFEYYMSNSVRPNLKKINRAEAVTYYTFNPEFNPQYLKKKCE